MTLAVPKMSTSLKIKKSKHSSIGSRAHKRDELLKGKTEISSKTLLLNS